MKKVIVLLSIVIATSFLLTGCPGTTSLLPTDGTSDSGGGNGNGNGTHSPANHPPVVMIMDTGSTSYFPGQEAYLYAVAGDEDGDTLTVQWSVDEKPAGSAVSASSFSDDHSLAPTFTPDYVGSYKLTVSVSDGQESASDSVTISVEDTAPVADLSTNHTMVIDSNTPVTLTGTGTDPDPGETLAYAWAIVSQPGGASVSAPSGSTGNSSGDQKSYGLTLTTEGDYVVSFTVTDSHGVSNTSTKVVSFRSKNTSGNSQPVAHAGFDETVDPDYYYYTLDGTASADPDGDHLTCTWALTEWQSAITGTSDINFYDNFDGTASFSRNIPPGAYTFELTVDDGKGFDGTDGTNESSTATDSVTITITNKEPSVYISSSPSVAVGSSITISGSGYDPNGGLGHMVTMEYQSAPSGSSQPAITEDTSSPNFNQQGCQYPFTFTPDVVGEYKLIMKIVDGVYTVESMPITITAYDSSKGGIDVTVQ